MSSSIPKGNITAQAYWQNSPLQVPLSPWDLLPKCQGFFFAHFADISQCRFHAKFKIAKIFLVLMSIHENEK